MFIIIEWSITLRFSIIILIDKPEVTITPASPFTVIEGQPATLECSLKVANPNTSITWKWFRNDNANIFLHNQPTFMINDIQRNESGQYGCTAENTAGTSNVPTVNIVVLCMYFQIWYDFKVNSSAI